MPPDRRPLTPPTRAHPTRPSLHHASIDVGEGVAGARRVLVDEEREALLELPGQLPLEALHAEG
eukprot:scaffold100821_cov60-Phaeocystis_antarctica.AAC.4